MLRDTSIKWDSFYPCGDLSVIQEYKDFHRGRFLAFAKSLGLDGTGKDETAAKADRQEARKRFNAHLQYQGAEKFAAFLDLIVPDHLHSTKCPLKAIAAKREAANA